MLSDILRRLLLLLLLLQLRLLRLQRLQTTHKFSGKCVHTQNNFLSKSLSTILNLLT